MKQILTKGLLALSVLPLTWTLATAQQLPDTRGEKFISPFTYAASAEKAAVLENGVEGEKSKVINGTVSKPGAWPWQVALLRVDVERELLSQFCGGSMIQNDWVLTAAHCLIDTREDGNFLSDPKLIKVMVGNHEISNARGDIVTVEKIYVHEDYNPNGFDNDIALIKLSKVPKADFKTITIPTAEYADILERQGTTTIVTGWGVTEDGRPSGILREAQIQMIDRNICNEVLMKSRLQAARQIFGEVFESFNLSDDAANGVWKSFVGNVKPPLSANMICSGTPEGPRGACNGDSGGPLVVPVADGKYIQAGIVSWGLTESNGKGCSKQVKFSAYTRAGNYVDWVVSSLNGNNTKAYSR